MMGDDILTKINVVGFFHTYAHDGELDPYMRNLAAAFAKRGVNLHLILVNDLFTRLDYKYYRPGISQQKILDFIKEVDPAFIFSTNRCGITQLLMEKVRCPIVTYMVDLMPFYHQGGEEQPLFCEKDVLLTPTSNSVVYWEEKYPVLQGKVYHMPFSTDPEDFSDSSHVDQDTNISFVGTYFYANQVLQLLKHYQEDQEVYSAILSLIQEVEKDYDLDFQEALGRLKLLDVLKGRNIGPDIFKMTIANLISLNSRVKYLDAVSDQGLKLYGTKNWVDVAQYSLDLLRCFQFDQFIKTREQLVDVYQRSKIALNISHHQAVNGFPYRIFDIMASNALLITEYKENSDLFKLFGKNMPIPMYRDENELKELVHYYLTHEEERLKCVAECNQLIANGHTFEDRIKKIFSLLDIRLDSSDQGKVNHVDVDDVFVIPVINEATQAVEIMERSSKQLLKRVLLSLRQRLSK